MAELKPCPRCFEDNKIAVVSNPIFSFCMCFNCQLMGPDGVTEEAAISAWNKRS